MYLRQENAGVGCTTCSCGSLHQYSPIDPEQSPCCNKRVSWRPVLGAVLCFALVLGLGSAPLLLKNETENKASPREFGRVAGSTTTRFDGKSPEAWIHVRTWNAYTRDDHAQQQKQLYPWEHLAEPFRATTLEVARWSEELGSDPGFRRGTTRATYLIYYEVRCNSPSKSHSLSLSRTPTAKVESKDVLLVCPRPPKTNVIEHCRPNGKTSCFERLEARLGAPRNCLRAMVCR